MNKIKPLLTAFWQGTLAFLSRRSRAFLPLALIGFSILVVWVMTANKPPLATKQDGGLRIPVDVMVAQPRGINIQIDSYGNVQPYRQTKLSAELGGNVVEITEQFLVGSFFRKGDVLLRIDDRDYRADMERAVSTVARARSQLALEQSRSQSALRDWRAIYPDRKQAASELTLRKPQLAQAEAELSSALADYNKAQLNLDRTVIRAPYNGLVRERNVELGQYIGRGDVLGVIYATDYAEVRLPIPEQQLGYLDLPNGSSETRPLVSLSAPVGDEVYRWFARVVRAENILDYKSRNLFVVAMVPDPYGLNLSPADYADYVPLRYGVFVNAVINGRRMDNLVVIPRRLLGTDNTVWLVKDSVLDIRPVKVLQTDGEEVYVHQGINKGELINLSPLSNVLPGTRADIVKRLPAKVVVPATSVPIEEVLHQNLAPENNLKNGGSAPTLTGLSEGDSRQGVEMERLQ